MKILQINTDCGSGSIGRIMVDLYREMEREGNECYIAYGRGKTPNDIKTIRIGTKKDVYFHATMTRITDRCGFYSKKATKEFIRKVREISPDIIHLHNIHGYYINIKLLFDFLRDFEGSAIWTLHDCWPFTGHAAYCDAVQCEKWETGCYDCPQMLQYPKAFVDVSRKNWTQKKSIFSKVNNLSIVTPSRWLEGMVKRSFLSEYSVQVINNGIDTTIFRPKNQDMKRRYGFEDNIVILGVASVWDKRKGLKDFIALSERLDERYKIILVGLSEKQIKELPNAILGLKRTSNLEELVDIYNMADIFFCPTYEDNYPTVILEASACGTPVITYQTGGAPETIKGHCGKIFRQGDIDDVSGYILSGSWRKDRFSEKSCYLIRDEIDKKRMVLEYKRLIEEIEKHRNSI